MLGLTFEIELRDIAQCGTNDDYRMLNNSLHTNAPVGASVSSSN